MKLPSWLLPLGIAASLGLARPAHAAAQPVDLALVLAVDVSGSVNEERFELQRRGYATAFASPEIVEAVAAGPHQAIAVTLVEWSGTGQHRQVIDWTVIDREAAAGFGSAIAEAPRVFAEMTALGEAIDYAAALLHQGGYGDARLVIDVSGDGSVNAGRLAREARDEAVASGITINGLPILAEEPDLDRYYHDSVIGGAGAFMVVAHDFDAFADAIRKKLVREIAGSADGTKARFAAAPGEER